MIDEQPTYYEWLTERGIAVRTSKTGRYRRGNFAFISVKGFGKGKSY
jgi:hypothetical protein